MRRGRYLRIAIVKPGDFHEIIVQANDLYNVICSELGANSLAYAKRYIDGKKHLLFFSEAAFQSSPIVAQSDECCGIDPIETIRGGVAVCRTNISGIALSLTKKEALSLQDYFDVAEGTIFFHISKPSRQPISRRIGSSDRFIKASDIYLPHSKTSKR